MHLTDQDREMFKHLSQGGLGRNLVDYLRRLEAHICDSRQWGPTDTKEGANRLAAVIESELCDKIMLQNSKKLKDDKDNFI